jgi:hypothetical protein
MDQNPYEQIPAKPTKYNGRLYRSRLEARVAAYFDIIEWDHEFEPFDLPGWSPDFLIKAKKAGITDMLVEVKPKFDMFNITKYLGVDFNKYDVACFCPEQIVFLSKDYIMSVDLKNSSAWKEAANKAMFLKPEFNG